MKPSIVIARMREARDIHASWMRWIKRARRQKKRIGVDLRRVGDVAWHARWVRTYNAVIALLKKAL